MSTKTPEVLTDHVLYKLQDKANKMPRGFAFVRIDGSFDNSGGGFDFLPVSGDITTAMNGDQVEMIRLLAEAINEDEVKHENGVVEADLNLSEASSTNDTTLDECRSVSSFLSPILPPVKLHDNIDFASIQSTESVSHVESNGNIRFNENDPVIKTEYRDDEEEKNIKPENVFSPVVGSPRCVSLASFTIASLAAEVVSEINAKEKMNERGLAINRNKDELSRSSSTKRDEVEGYFRSAKDKENLSEEDFNKFNKPFCLGWKRECVVKENYIISDIYYITPPRGTVQGKRLRHPSSITKFLSEEGNDTNLMLENFSFKRVFLGFEAQHELFRLAGKSTRPKSSGDNKMYGNFFEFTQDKYRCLLCGNFVKYKGNMAGHVKRVHEPDVKCEKCGRDFSALHIQNHQAACTGECKDFNENELKGVKRKAQQGSEKPNEKIIRVAELGSSINTIQEKSYSTCKGGTSWASTLTVEESAETNTEDYCEIIEPDDEYFHPISLNTKLDKTDEPVSNEQDYDHTITLNTEENTAETNANDYCEIIEPDDQGFQHNSSNIKLDKTDEPMPNQHDYDCTISQNTEDKTESYNAQHEGSEIQPKDQSPVPQEVASGIDSKKVTLEMSSVEGTRVKMQVKVNAKLTKAMKKFGVKMGVRHQDLRFILDGKELTGEELVEGLDGAQILVERKAVALQQP